MGSSNKEVVLRLKAAAEEAIGAIGLGYDLTEDLRLKYCKGKSPESRLIGIDDEQVRDIAIPGGILIQNVSKSINCDKGERMRFSSDILSFQQMAEQFNQDVKLSGRIPTGQFNAAFEFTGSWQKDAMNTKALALDGVFITLYNITLEKSQIALCDHVKNAVPSSWEPATLAKFIQKYGTHVIAGIKMGGKDVVYLKQQHSSTLPPDEVLRKLKDVAEKRFSGQPSDSMRKNNDLDPLERNDYGLINLVPAVEDITVFWRRRGGSYGKNLDHRTWCQTVQLEPQVISMSLIPITSLLSGIDGNGFLTHAINLYIRFKPPIEELQQFLEFQLPTRWAPEFGELAVGPEGKQNHSASLQFRFMGPKLYVNTNQVDVGNTPVTGLRLYLEGKKNDCLAIHLQHLSSMPKSFKLVAEPIKNSLSPHSQDRRYHEKVQWKSFSHICTAPVESDDEHSIVTGAEFEVSDSGLKRVLFLRLQFSKVVGATVVRQPEWDGSPVLVTQKSGIVSTLISTRFSSAQKPTPQPKDIILNSALPIGPPVTAQGKKLLKFVDTSELVRGPQDLPGYWVVSGARLMVDKSKISLRAKFSLLAVIPADEESLLD
ncbi:putative MACPF domain-containing protein CAD1/NSL1 [Helianthus annuus]|uniref:Membrane attack complex component/perforin (MACPF) domain-containing protein n=1 Tax=Helianthus annuus TaxID=4232 RepID=A0A251VQT9_HELAN|nr:MACPF domain-containing protein At4g24290 [Helianthus annuus]KAF5822609.1 putative membrane attack complex component/perforin (MACPF) domain-containing protein [Helianthus annuus]KAJ0627420.1 putative MACPF domain-containing protein CAD1/NSL1 [Helianthus annuus]KAJ0810185.1 putative MACPF domain-containing protein CAD1/NSL1 [Helianthus annuus]